MVATRDSSRRRSKSISHSLKDKVEKVSDLKKKSKRPSPSDKSKTTKKRTDNELKESVCYLAQTDHIKKSMHSDSKNKRTVSQEKAKRTENKLSEKSVNKSRKRKSTDEDPCPIEAKKPSPDLVKHRTTNASERKSGKSKISDDSHKKAVKKKKIKDSKSRCVKTEESVHDGAFSQTSAASIHEMLLQHEIKTSSQLSIMSMTPPANVGSADSSSSEESDWEEVEGEELKPPSPKKSQSPTKSVEITVDAPSIMRKKRKKTSFDMEEWFRLQVNRYRRETQSHVHKVHLLCLVATDRYRNMFCKDQLLLAVAMSLVPTEIFPKSRLSWELPEAVKFTRWFCGEYHVAEKSQEKKLSMRSSLMKCLQSKKAVSNEELVWVYVLIGRAVGMTVRFIHSLQPVTHKASDLKAKKNESSKSSHHSDDEKGDDKTKVDGKKKDDETKADIKTNGDRRTKAVKTDSKPKAGSNKAKHSKKSRESYEKTDRGTLREKKCDKKHHVKVKPETSEKQRRRKAADAEGKKMRRRRECRGKVKSLAEDASDDEDECRHGNGSSEDEFEPSETSYGSPAVSKPRKRRSSKVKAISPDSSDTGSNENNQAVDYWAEVLVNGKWICVDVVQCKVNKPGEMEKHASQPLCYVLAYYNDGCVKDITKKYASSWMSHTRKLRVDSEWWQLALLPLYRQQTDADAVEDAEIEANLIKKPLPTSVGDYKNHPMYALRRHLLKFEALYPDTAVPLGYIRNEPVYARECVHTLHSRQNWLKEARLVRVGEKPYKLVKGRKTKRRLREGDEDPVLELFGQWQTEDYIPPPAFNGKVPRNEYGNVELFKPCMLPGGTVHLKGLPGLNRVAKKLGLDCVAAMTGWDAHGGHSHPVLDGWVVCEENKDTLLAAWDEEQEIIAEREAEKRDKRIYGNWTKLVKGLLIKEKLKNKYDLQEKVVETKKKPSGKKKTEKATDVPVSWPRNRQTDKPDKGLPDHFPFEVEQL